MEVIQRGAQASFHPLRKPADPRDKEDVEDLEDAPDAETEAIEEQVLDEATAARSIGELRIEIDTLKRLEGLALSIRRSGEDKKWRELATLLGEIFTPAAIANRFSEEAEPYDPASQPRPSRSPRRARSL